MLLELIWELHWDSIGLTGGFSSEFLVNLGVCGCGLNRIVETCIISNYIGGVMS